MKVFINLLLFCLQMFLFECHPPSFDSHSSKILNLISDYKPTETNQISILDTDTENPLIPKLDEKNANKRTLVLDLDETLIHTFGLVSANSMKVRPGLNDFLESMSSTYELILWSVGIETYVKKVLKIIDPDNKFFAHVLCKQHSTNGKTKPLSRLNRNMKTTLILDNNPDSYSVNPQNGVPIIDFINDDKDHELYVMRLFFERLATVDEENVLGIVNSYQAFYKKRYQ